jgi:hypothetical protein
VAYFLEVELLQVVLVLEEMFVHGPEVRLCASGLGCQRGGARVWMDLFERKVSEHKAESARELPLQLMHRETR